MADSFLLLETGDYLLQQDCASKIILETGVVAVGAGGPAGGKSKAVGAKSLAEQQLGDRKTTKSFGQAFGKIRYTNNNVMVGAITIPVHAKAESVIQLPSQKGFSHGSLTISTYNESKSYIRVPEIADGIIREDQRAFFEPTGYELKQYYEKLDKLKKVVELLKIYHSINDIDNKYRHFEFNETVKDEKLRAFTHSSSFVGNVQYNTETQEMKMVINGKEYTFCGVSERLFDAFEGASSKGAFFNREIKNLHDC